MAVTNGRKRVAVVYHFWPHYREPIAHHLCQQVPPLPEYVLVSGRAQTTTAEHSIDTIDPAKATRTVAEGGLRWHFVRNVWLGRHFLWQSGLLRLTLSRRFDVIIYLGSMYFLSTWVSALCARLSGVKVLMWSHGYLRPEHGIRGFLRRNFYRIANGMLLYGHRARQLMLQDGFPGHRLYVIYNSLDYFAQRSIRERTSAEAIQATRARLFAHPTLPVLFFVGRLTHRKRLDMLVAAVARLHREGSPVNLLLIGTGPAEQQMRQLAAASQIADYLHFHGACYREEQLGSLIVAADICVSPGDVGLTAIHAMAYGKPVITHGDVSHQMPEAEAIIPGETGDLFTYGDEASLAKTLAAWIADRRFAGAADACISLVERHYNPTIQARLINDAVRDVTTRTAEGRLPRPHDRS